MATTAATGNAMGLVGGQVAATHLNQGMMACGGWQQYRPVTKAEPHDAGASTTAKQEMAAFRAWERGNAAKALHLWDTILEGTNAFPEEKRVRLESNRVPAIRALDADNAFARYPYDVIESICETQRDRRANVGTSVQTRDAKGKDKADVPDNGGVGDGNARKAGVTVVILSCKRYHLFTRTVNSFLWACTDLDLVTRWICIDDGSHPTERACMEALYPFFEFVWRSASDPDVAGHDVQSHARSLNVARSMVDTEWVLTLEDDWLFVTRTNLITRCMCVMERERPNGVMQTFFNRHYIEDMTEGYLSMSGGIEGRDAHGRRYIVHEHITPGTPEYEAYCRRHPHNFAHQPHYSCRPCLMRTAVWTDVGPFRESGKRGAAQGLLPFEEEYARRYAALGFKSAFLDAIPCIHIGRPNRERTNPNASPNAYQLNGEPQYGQDCLPVPKTSPLKGQEGTKAADALADGAWASHDASVGPAPHPPGHRLALTVTTCRRLAAFLRSMTMTLAMCKDVARFDRFVVIDDNSCHSDREAMRARFPFFEYILKGPEKRGHAISMNMVLDATQDCSMVLHTEDDWDFNTPFAVGDAAVLIRDLDVGQVILRWHEKCTAARLRHQPADGGAPFYYRAHYYDPNDPCTPGFFVPHRERLLKELEAEKQRMGDAWPHPPMPETPPEARAKKNVGCWWPALSLNPAVWNMRFLRATGERFAEKMDSTFFEYDISVRTLFKGMRVVMFEGEMGQLPAVAAYPLNATTRMYDASGCANHRHMGGDPGCTFCVTQKAEYQRTRALSTST